MKCILTLFLLFSLPALGQSSDFLALKKKGKTIKYYYKGTQIEFVSTTGAYRNALISDIKKDTIYLQEFLIRRVPTSFGAVVTDTAGSFSYRYHYHDVASFGRQQKGFNVSGSGAALMGGGLLLTLASGVAYLADKDKFSPELLGAAVGLGVLGYFINRAASRPIVIGKKYSLEYIGVSAQQNAQ